MIVGEFSVFIISSAAIRQRLSWENSYFCNLDIGLAIVSDVFEYVNKERVYNRERIKGNESWSISRDSSDFLCNVMEMK